MANVKVKAKHTFRKFIGWLLLIAGLLIIGWALFSSYQIFLAQKPAPPVFKVQEKEIKTEKVDQTKPSALEEKTKELFQEQLTKMLPPNFSPLLFNLISWSIFATILIFGGSKISFIGIRLLR